MVIFKGLGYRGDEVGKLPLSRFTAAISPHLRSQPLLLDALSPKLKIAEYGSTVGHPSNRLAPAVGANPDLLSGQNLYLLDK